MYMADYMEYFAFIEKIRVKIFPTVIKKSKIQSPKA